MSFMIRSLVVSATLAALLIAGCRDDPTGPGGPGEDECDADNGGLTLPAGFCAVVVTKTAGVARQMVVRPNGDLYVAINNAPDGGPVGGVLALRDTDGDGRADVQQKFGPTGGNGIAWHDDKLYFAPNNQVLRYSFTGNELVPTAAPEVIISGLPSDGDHRSKTLVIPETGPFGDRIFLNIGSGSNSCQVDDRVDGSPGIDPCPELAVRAGVWLFDLTPGQTQASGQRFATELRNMVALAVDPDDGELYGAQNGRDQLFDNWGGLFTEQDDALLPAEELFRIEQDNAYGWPYCFYDPIQQKKVLSPEYGGDGDMVGRCADRENPLATYPAHWAPLSMMFYSGSMFPSQYHGGLLIAWHGSRFDPSQQPAGPGFVVTFTQWNGGPTGTYSTFAGGFAGATATPSGAAHRPVGLAMGPDGSIYVSDDKAGWIWRIIYTGD